VGKEALVKSVDQELVSRSTSRAFCFFPGLFPPGRYPTRLSATLVRGRDTYGHFDLEPHPVADLDPAAIAAHQDSNALDR
jgi:hypothetical protein